ESSKDNTVLANVVASLDHDSVASSSYKSTNITRCDESQSNGK
ncbi:377_t:CDS:1, partial [Racocetra fulgida]